MDLSSATISCLYDRMRTHGHLEDIFLGSTATLTDRRCFHLQISPLPCRRTASVVSDFIPLTPFRSRSAARPLTVPGHVMQRHSNVSVARLYDWSEQDKEEPLSVSRLYREIAGGVRVPLPRNLGEKARPRASPNGVGAAAVGGSWPGGSSPRVSPGRMFLRDKGMLTKGEREIIQGIYKNRGDLRKHPLNNKSDFNVRSHHDAWLVGKPGAPSNKPSTEVPRESPRGSLMEVTAPAANHNIEPSRPAAVSDAAVTGNGSPECHPSQPHTTCIVCIREQQLLEQLQLQKQQQKLQKARLPTTLPPASSPSLVTVNDTFRPRGEIAPAPSPVTPSPSIATKEYYVKSPSVHNTTSPPSPAAKLLPKRQKEARDRSESPPKISLSNPIANPISPWIEHGDTGSESEESLDSEGSRRRLHVKVYLPMVAPDAADEDLRACMLEGRPAIARGEKHLSYSDLKPTRRESEGDVGLGEQTEKEKVKENGDVKKKREKVKNRLKIRHPRSRRNSKSDEVVRQTAAVDNDIESNKAHNGRRVFLHTHPVTILKANIEEEVSRQQD